jgi:hypothetical protein
VIVDVRTRRNKQGFAVVSWPDLPTAVADVDHVEEDIFYIHDVDYMGQTNHNGTVK